VRDGQELMVDEDGQGLALTVNTRGLKAAHFASFPARLVEVLLRASTSRVGRCPKCAAQFERVANTTRDGRDFGRDQDLRQSSGSSHRTINGKVPSFKAPESTTTGWHPTCTCSAGKPEPPVVLDPFWGAGTVSLIAERMGVNSIGCELNPAYVRDIGVPRVTGDCPMFTELEIVTMN
jgi:hypothetical protein